MQNTNPFFPDYQKGYEAACADIIGMGFESSRDKFNFEFPQGKPIADSGQRAWALGYFDALCNA